ncbi:MAG: hypothetical protein A2W09_08295, partial [Deltaproteobacteria bacterium RBG_16_50_11]
MKDTSISDNKSGYKNSVLTILSLFLSTILIFIALPALAGRLDSDFQAAVSGSGPSIEKHLKAEPGNKPDKDSGLKYKEDEILVKFKPDVPEDRKDKLHKKHGSEKIKDFPSLRIHHIKLKKGLSVEDAIKLYKDDSDVEYAELNYLVTIQNTPNDPLFNYLWNMHNTGQNGGTPGADIKAPEAWDITKGSTDIVVAVIDTGIDYNHEDLAANMWVNLGEIASNGIDDDKNGYIDDIYGIDVVNHDTNPMDDYGHGTHVAGIIGAAGNNALGVVGVNWNVKIMSCKFLNKYGGGYVDGAITCLQYINSLKNRGVNIIATNNSWGGGGYSQALYDAINDQRDILFIAAAGNSHMDNDFYNMYPATYYLPNVISVAATDANDGKPSFSDYGRRSVQVSAPGVDVVSLRAHGTDMYGDNGPHFIPQGDSNSRYYKASGTSMAAPHVTGLAALIKSQDMNRDWRAIKNLIQSGGDNVPAFNGKTITGKRISAHGSLTCVNSPLFSAVKYPFTPKVGVPTTLSALSINCGSPVGAVTVTTEQGEVIKLFDDGVAPDVAEGDGIFTGTWVPSREAERLTFSSPAGSDVISVPLFIITSSYLPEGNIKSQYSHFLEGKGGLPPYTWSIVSGSLPLGLALNSLSGEISGLPVKVGSFAFTVQMIDSFNVLQVKSLSIRVSDDFIIERLVRTYDSGMDDEAHDIILDAGGNIYVAGSYLDPSSGSHDYLTTKYDPTGHMIWAKTYGTPCDDYPTKIRIDSGGNVYVIGNSFGVNCDTSLMKYDSSGNLIWVKNDLEYNGQGFYNGMAIDAEGNIYLTGPFWLGSSYTNLVTEKYDPSGKLLWTNTYGSYATGEDGYGITVDESGNVYVAGAFYGNTMMDFLTLKYNKAGNLLWVKTYQGEHNGFAYGIALDGSGNIYVAGPSFNGTKSNYLVFKYDPSGQTLWSQTYDTGKDDYATDIAVDGSGNAFVTGYSFNGSNLDYLTVKYDQSGNVLWAKSLDAGGNDEALGIAVDGNGDPCVTGYLWNGLNYDWLTIKYGLAADSFRIVPSGLPLGTVGVSYSQTLTAANGVKPYTWAVISGSLPGGLSLNSSTGVIAGVPTTTGTFDFTVQAMDANLATATKELSISVYNPLIITSPSLFSGAVNTTYSQAMTATGGKTPYTWSIYSGSLPNGLFLNASTGEISGTPISVGTFNFTIQVEDANFKTCTKALSIVIIDNRPDLAVSAVSVPTAAGAGITITITDTTKNSGAGDAASSTTGYYLSTDSTFDGADVKIGSRAVDALAAGASSSGTASALIPAGTPSGSYYIIARADADNMVVETNEDNNTKYSTSIKIGPDFTVTALTAPTTAGAGTSISVTDTTKNSGAGDAGASTTRFYLSTDSTLDSTDTLLNGSRAVPALAAGESSSGTASALIPAGTPAGTYYIIAKADGDDLIPETNETNNTKYSTSIKIGPDLIVSAVTAPSTAGAGKSISVTDTTKNSGAGDAASSTTGYYLSTDSTFDGADVKIGSRVVDALAAGAGSSGTASALIPTGTPSGSYYIIARADADDMVVETREDNNTKYSTSIKIGPDFTVTAMTVPATTGAGKTVSVTDTTKNSGAGDAASSSTGYYLSTDSTLDGADVKIGSRAVDALAAGASSSGTASALIPTGTPSGSYYIIARADADDMVVETREDNNTKYSTSIKIGPDFTVTAMTVPATTGAGKTVSVTDTTKNSGAGDAASSSTNFYLSTDSTLDGADVKIGSRTVDALAPGASSSGTTSLAIPADTLTGAYYI